MYVSLSLYIYMHTYIHTLAIYPKGLSLSIMACILWRAPLRSRGSENVWRPLSFAALL